MGFFSPIQINPIQLPWAYPDIYDWWGHFLRSQMDQGANRYEGELTAPRSEIFQDAKAAWKANMYNDATEFLRSRLGRGRDEKTAIGAMLMNDLFPQILQYGGAVGAPLQRMEDIANWGGGGRFAGPLMRDIAAWGVVNPTIGQYLANQAQFGVASEAGRNAANQAQFGVGSVPLAQMMNNLAQFGAVGPAGMFLADRARGAGVTAAERYLAPFLGAQAYSAPKFSTMDLSRMVMR